MMLFSSRQVDGLREQHGKSRWTFYAMSAAPVIMYIFAICMLSADQLRVVIEDLQVVRGRIAREAAASGEGQMELVYPCGRKSVAVTFPVTELARDRGESVEQVAERFKAGDPLKVGVDANCRIQMLSVSQPPFLVYLLVTVFMGLVTAAWCAFLYGIWLGQGVLLKAWRV